MKRILVTGSSGLVGSETVQCFDAMGWRVVGVDNNMRKDFLGPQADTTGNLGRLKENTQRFEHQNVDIRSRRAVGLLLARERFDLIVHLAGQPSPDVARRRPLDDFDVNASGTLNLLEAARQSCPQAPFITLSSREVYGQSISRLPLVETKSRYDYARTEDHDGVSEECSVDLVGKGVFGASRLSAEMLTLEYGHEYNMPTCVLRAGCITGQRQAAAELHGFLGHMVRTALRGERYTIIGHKGKQVRDPLHARDLVRAMHLFAEHPRRGQVYNLGGGRENSISIQEALARIQSISGRAVATQYQPVVRASDPACYISNTAKFRSHYPDWRVSVPLDAIIRELLQADTSQAAPAGPPAATDCFTLEPAFAIVG